MKEDKLLSLIGDIDDEYIKEAAEYKIEKAQKPKAVSFWVKNGCISSWSAIGCILASASIFSI